MEHEVLVMCNENVTVKFNPEKLYSGLKRFQKGLDEIIGETLSDEVKAIVAAGQNLVEAIKTGEGWKIFSAAITFGLSFKAVVESGKYKEAAKDVADGVMEIVYSFAE